MNNEDFTLANEGEKSYEYTHGDMTAKVSFDGFINGDRIGVHCYTDNGEKMGYYSFRVSNADDRTAHYQRKNDEEPPTAAVVAIHSSGWVVENVSAATITEENDDLPTEIKLLNIRDMIDDLRKEVKSDFEKAELKTITEVVEGAAVLCSSLSRVDSEDKDGFVRRYMKQQQRNKPEAFEMDSIEDMVYGHLQSSIDPDATRQTKHHRIEVNKMELGRDLMLAGATKEDYHRMQEDFNE